MVPEGLRPLITRRLEALVPEERLALEVASVAGTEYATAMVAAGLQQNVEEVERRFESLATRGSFIGATGLAHWPDGTLSGRYRFQHALYQQVLYEHVGAARRSQLHRRLGERLEAAYGARAYEMAAELAVHFEQGHDVGRAVQYLQHAGDSALQRSAHQEAMALLTKALAMLPTLADTPERAQQERRLLLALGAAVVVTKGYAAPEVADTYARARELCRHMDDTPEHFHVLWGLWSFELVRGQLQTARELAEYCMRLAQHLGDPTLVLESHNMRAQTLSYLGEFPLAQTHAEQGFALYDAAHHPALASRYVRDPGVLCLFYKAWNLWFLGYADQALCTGRDALAFAQRLAHPFSLVAALYLMAVVTRCQEHGFALWVEQGTVLHGWALAAQGQVDEGITEMRQGLTAYLATGARRARVSFLLGLGEAYTLSGQTASGHDCLTEALKVMDAQSEHWCEAELYRLRGELLIQEGVGFQAHGQREEDVQACFQQALTVARGQQAKLLELRAAISLCRLWQQQGQREEARELLVPIYAWFTEGFDTADLLEAKELLDALQA
jgi:predicted ATPase